MADNTGRTRPGEAEAVEAVAAALFKFEGYDDPYDVALNADYNQPEHWVEEYRDRARAAIAAAYPVIAAAVREQAAQDIEAMDEPDWHTGGTLGAEEMGWAWAQDDAARVARGGR